MQPLYEVGELNSPVTLYEGDISVEQGGSKVKCVGTIKLLWLPRPRLEVTLDLTTDGLFSNPFDFENMLSVYVEDIGLSESAYLTSFQSNSITAELQSGVELGRRENIHHLQFHLVNFVNYLGEAITDDGEGWRRDALIFEDGTWKVTLHARDLAKDTFRQLKVIKGYAITHIGKLERLDGAEINSDEIDDLLDKLFWFFSFIRGAFVPPWLVVGFNREEQKGWEKWNLNKSTHSWETENSWFPKFFRVQGGEWDRLFPGFMKRLKDEAWQEAVTQALSWYASNQVSPNVETGLLLSKLGVELLAWAKFVEIEQRLSPKGFKSLELADRLRLLLTEYGIPVGIPPELTELTKVSREQNWIDGPCALMILRNGIVHPNLRNRVNRLPGIARYEAWKLSQWYLELCLLYLFEYEGQYRNRLPDISVATAMEPVPWAS